MPSGFYLRTEEHRKKISLGLMGHFPWSKGFHHSEETKRKIGIASLGHTLSVSARNKISQAQRGVCDGPMSEEVKRKIGLANKGKKRTEETKRRMSLANRGKKLSKEHIAKMVMSKTGKPNLGCRGEKSHFWKGGITPKNKLIRRSIDFSQWRDAVFTRDNYTDRKTGIRGGKLHPHHVLNFSEYPELRFDIDNGVTLSEESHINFHKKYGWKDNTREQLQEFLTK